MMCVIMCILDQTRLFERVTGSVLMYPLLSTAKIESFMFW